MAYYTRIKCNRCLIFTLELGASVCYYKDNGKGGAIFKMPIVYKLDVIQALKDKGYNTNRIRKEKIMGEAMLQKLRSGQMVSWATLETICALLQCDVGDILHFTAEGDASAE